MLAIIKKILSYYIYIYPYIYFLNGHIMECVFLENNPGTSNIMSNLETQSCGCNIIFMMDHYVCVERQRCALWIKKFCEPQSSGLTGR